MKSYNLPDIPYKDYLTDAQTCACLINVASQMAADWIAQGSPEKENFDWKPNDPCVYSQQLFSQFDFSNAQIIWSHFGNEKKGKDVTEPFAILLSKGDTSYLVFRGTQTNEDWTADLKPGLVDYSPEGKVRSGFYGVFKGMNDLEARLRDCTTEKLIVAGHSLGSTLATLAAPLALQCGFSSNSISVYPNASPKVGDSDFANYFDSLGINTYRLVNTKDLVPTTPRSEKYHTVGVEIRYEADYEDEGRNHNPCCSYAYAIFNPDSPKNPDNDGEHCIFPAES